MDEGFATGFDPGVTPSGDPRVSRSWLQDRHHPLLGRHVPLSRMPDFPDVLVVPGHAKDRVLPTHFRAYTRTSDGAAWSDVGATYEEARWNLEQRVANLGPA